MKAKKYMHNSPGDNFKVFVIAKKNFTNQWTTTTLENARKSIKLFFKECKYPRNSAIIKDKNNKLLEEIINN